MSTRCGEPRVVVTGIGVVAPNGIGKDEFWSSLESGRSFIEEDEEMKALGIRSTVLARVRRFDPARFFSHTPALLDEDRFVQFAVASGMLAVEDAGLTRQPPSPESVGCILSTAVGGTPTVAATWERQTSCGRHPLTFDPVPMSFAHATCSNYPGAILMRLYGFEGISSALSTGCTAGIDALGLGFDLIRSGEATAMLVGASEAPLANISYATLDAIGSLAAAGTEPSKASRPFDARRSGFVLAEGAAVLAIETLDRARERGAHMYGEVLGFASGGNAHHMSDLPPDGEPMAKVIECVLSGASTAPDTIAYINAHGSSTPQNDVFETNAYKRVFKQRAYDIPISSTKSMIGHSLSAASLMGVIAALGALERSRVHPTAHLECADEACDLDYVPRRSRPLSVVAALVTASGFGGIHSAAVLRKVDLS